MSSNLNHLPKDYFYPNKDRIMTGIILLVISLLYAVCLSPLYEHIEVYFLPILFFLPAMYFLLVKKIRIFTIERNEFIYDSNVFSFGRGLFSFIIFPYISVKFPSRLRYSEVKDYECIIKEKSPIRVRLLGFHLTTLTMNRVRKIIFHLKNGKTIHLNMRELPDEQIQELDEFFRQKLGK